MKKTVRLDEMDADTQRLVKALIANHEAPPMKDKVSDPAALKKLAALWSPALKKVER